MSKLNDEYTLCYLGLGGNLGHPLTLFNEVGEYFKQHALVVGLKESPRYESTPVDASGPNFINSVLEVQWLGNAQELLQACFKIENKLGRVRTTRNAPRPIDVDVLLVGQQSIHTENLTVPHPRMHLRRFVLEPLLNLNTEVKIPGLGFARNYLPATQGQSVHALPVRYT